MLLTKNIILNFVFFRLSFMSSHEKEESSNELEALFSGSDKDIKSEDEENLMKDDPPHEVVFLKIFIKFNFINLFIKLTSKIEFPVLFYRIRPRRNNGRRWITVTGNPTRPQKTGKNATGTKKTGKTGQEAEKAKEKTGNKKSHLNPSSSTSS